MTLYHIVTLILYLEYTLGSKGLNKVVSSRKEIESWREALQNRTEIKSIDPNEKNHLNEPALKLTESSHSRVKRALGNDLGEITLHLIEKASQTISPTEVNFGDSFTFEAVLDLPRVPIGNKSDLNIEVFSLDPEEGVAGFHICQAHVLFKGPQLKSIQEHPVYMDHSKPHYHTYIEKTKITFEQLHTNDEGSPDNDNEVRIQFQAVLVDHEQTQNGRQYYLTVGVDFAEQSFVWIGQAKIQTSIVPLDYDVKVDFHNPSSAIRKGNAEMFSVSAFITEPSADVEFGVFQPLGYNDIFHIGQISYSVGNAFACSRQDFWEERYIRSPSKLTVNNATLRYPFLINREAKRDVNNDVNRIQFQVPVHVLNIDSLTSGITRYLSFGLKIGEKKLWSALHEITIQKAEPVVFQEVPIFKKVSMVNNLTSSGRVLAGNSAVFHVEMIVKPGWSRFDVILSTDSGSPIVPVGAQVIRTGTVAYFPPEWTVTQRSDNAIVHNFGLVKNVDDTNPTTVVLEAAFAIHNNADDSSEVKVFISVGDQQTDQSVDIESNPNPKDVSVTINEYGFDDQLYLAGQAGFDMVVHVPSGSGSESLNFESVPDFDTTDFSLRLCRASIINIGRALPCVRHSDTLSKNVYSKSDDTKPFNDFGKIEIGRTCPWNYPASDEPVDNSFTANLIYELPRGQSFSGDIDVQISGGVRLGNNTIWVSSLLYKAKNEPLGKNITTSLDFMEMAGLATTPLPFVTSYPLITTRGRKSHFFDANEGFFIQYILKFQPGTRSDYQFVIEPPSPRIKICKLIISHIGENFPCAQPPGPTVTGHENIELLHNTDADSCGENATFMFWGLTNWGRNPIIHDLTPDENSIQIKAYFQVCQQGTTFVPEVTNVKYHMDPESIQGGSEIALSGKTKTFTRDRGIEGTMYKSLTGPDDVIYKRAPKLMRFDIRVPENYLGDITLMINNTHYDEDYVIIEMCDIAVVNVGENVPCLDVTKDVVTEYGTDYKVIGSETVHRTLLARMKGVCYVQVDSIDDASLITLEAVVRVRDVPEGTRVGLSVHVVPVGGFSESLSDRIDLTMVVADAMPGNITVDTLLPEEPYVSPLDLSEIYTETGQKVWIPFHIVLPLEKTVEMEATVLVPSADGVAIYHVTDVRFGDIEGGRNVPCTSANVHLQSAYPTFFRKTPNVTTLMQRDSVTIDLGYVMNTGFTKKQKKHNASNDDRFVIEIEVQMSDHPLAINGSDWNVIFVVKFGEIVIVANKLLHTLKSDVEEHNRGNIITNLMLTNEFAIKHVNSSLKFSLMIRHENDSRMEGHPGNIRMVLPYFLEFTDVDTVLSNYSIHNATDLVKISANGSYLDFLLPHITYPDVIHLQFTLTVDPFSKRLKGSGTELAAIAIAPLCYSNISEFLSPEGGKNCGPWAYQEMIVHASECYDPIPVFDHCQVMASSMISELFYPFNSVGTSDVWSPAIRTGGMWINYLEYDFLMVARVNKLVLKSHTLFDNLHYRKATKLAILTSNIPSNYHLVVEKEISNTNVIDFLVPIETRFLRIVIRENPSSDHSDQLPLGINGVSFFGCFSSEAEPDLSSCVSKRNTIDSSDKTQYRHFAVDHVKEIVFFCDFNPRMNETSCSSLTTKNSKIQLKQLPFFVRRIEGFSPLRGRTYLNGNDGSSMVSTIDGVIMELCDALPGDLKPPVGIPGDYLPPQKSFLWIGTDFMANYRGIYKSGKLILSWNSCCL